MFPHITEASLVYILHFSKLAEMKLFPCHCCTCHKNTSSAPSSFHHPITEAPQLGELLGNQNQLLVLSPVEPILASPQLQSSIFSESSLWTQWPPPLWPWHHRAMENLPHFLLFLQIFIVPLMRGRCGSLVCGMYHTSLSNWAVFHHLGKWAEGEEWGCGRWRDLLEEIT